MTSTKTGTAPYWIAGVIVVGNPQATVIISSPFLICLSPSSGAVKTINAIKSVNEGVGWIDPAIAKIVFSSIGMGNGLSDAVSNVNENRSKNTYGLTERELDVLELMTEGLSNPQIADKLVV